MSAYRFKLLARSAVIGSTLLGIVACGEAREVPEGDGSEANLTAAPFLAIFSAFPAEMAPILAQATVESTMTLNSRTFHVGTLRGTRVVMGITGVGLANAQASARAVLSALPVTGVVFSGVAGGPLRIGDVAVPAQWSLPTGATFAADASWLSVASGISSAAPCFEQCTRKPLTGARVCLDHVPGIAVGGAGQSSEPSVPVTCLPGHAEIFGCEVGTPEGATESCQPGGATSRLVGTRYPNVVDNETAVVAAEAAARGLRFIGFRGMSDGESDPLGLPGYPAQFFVYYRLAARNAAATTIAFVERAARLSSPH
jgi:nucleoside phosphorylase